MRGEREGEREREREISKSKISKKPRETRKQKASKINMY